MNAKRLAIVGIALVAVIAGGVFALSKDKEDQKTRSNTATKVSKNDDSSVQPESTASQTNASSGNYVTLADYNRSKGDYSDDKKVLFFHASWCPVCKSIDKEINAEPGRIPGGNVIIRTDFDSETELRKKYGVTYQYTFVQIDNSGQQIKKWTATTLDDVISQIE